jgi:hypothetical protein
VRTLRRLQRRVDETISSAGSPSRLGSIPKLAVELDRELARLETMPWPSGRPLASAHDSRTVERKLVPLVRAARTRQGP